jgi:hypothetical protein
VLPLLPLEVIRTLEHRHANVLQKREALRGFTDEMMLLVHDGT